MHNKNNKIILIILINAWSNKMTNTIDSEVRTRIIKAADELFDATNREQLPTVSAVRSAARVDMNSASLVMKEWRKALTAQASAKPLVTIPDVISNALIEVGAVAWQEAQVLASETLQAAQKSWDAERNDAEALRVDLASSFDEQEKLLNELKKSAVEAAETAAAAALSAEKDAELTIKNLADKVRDERERVVKLEVENKAISEENKKDLIFLNEKIQLLNKQLSEVQAALAAQTATATAAKEAQAIAEASKKEAIEAKERAEFKTVQVQAETQAALIQAAEARGQVKELRMALEAEQQKNKGLLEKLESEKNTKVAKATGK